MPAVGKKQARSNTRPDHDGEQRAAFESARKKIFASQTVCGICGKPVDMTLKFPHPLSKTIDHKIPVSLGGHPSDISNLQLAHWCCNRKKSNKLVESNTPAPEAVKVLPNRVLPLTFDWQKI